MDPRRLHYTGAPLDRAHLLRRDASALAGQAAVRVLPLWHGRHAVAAADGLTPLWSSAPPGPEAVFLGTDPEGVRWFVEDLSALPAVDPENRDLGPGDGAGALDPLGPALWRDLRAFGVGLSMDLGAMLAYARGMVFWHGTHRFCGRCGSATESREAGHVRRCVNVDCGASSFPRTDPAVIMLVTHGDHCLLGRQPRWPEGMVSTLAGFVEPGESLEEAVAREVEEEAGVRIARAVYGGSQPWPFPSSLMVGFWAEAATTDIQVDAEELEMAFWVHREELAGFGDMSDPQAGGKSPWKLPRRDSISRWLIDTWREGGSGL